MLCLLCGVSVLCCAVLGLQGMLFFGVCVILFGVRVVWCLLCGVSVLCGVCVMWCFMVSVWSCMVSVVKCGVCMVLATDVSAGCGVLGVVLGKLHASVCMECRKSSA